MIGSFFGATDPDAIHRSTAAEIATVPAKMSPVSADLLLIEDSAASNAKRRITIGTLPGGGGAVWSVVTETTASRSAAGGEFILIDAVTCVVTLPAPAAGARVAAKAIAASPVGVEVRTSGAGILIDGTDYSAAGLSLTAQWEQISLISDGTDWFIY